MKLVANEFRKGDVTRILLALLVWTAMAAAQTQFPAFTSDRTSYVFRESDPIVFHLSTAGHYDWFVSDWQGQEVSSGTWEAPGALTLPDLPIGYYRLRLRGSAGFLPFARISSVVRPDGSPYAADSAGGSEQIVTLEELAGLRIVRGRFQWDSIQPKPGGEFQWSAADASVELWRQHGIKVLGVFHDAPEWTKQASVSLPTDLMALYRFCRELAVHFKGRVPAWEFWNEEDLNVFNRDAAWDYAAAQKAAYLGFKAGDPSVKVLNGANAFAMPHGAFMDTVFLNGVEDYFDIYNFHVYLPVEGVAGRATHNLGMLARHGMHKPFYVTEIGLVGEGDGRGQPVQAGSDRLEHDEEQERAQVEHLVKSQVIVR